MLEKSDEQLSFFNEFTITLSFLMSYYKREKKRNPLEISIFKAGVIFDAGVDFFFA